MAIFGKEKGVRNRKEQQATQDQAKAHIMGILAPLVEEAVSKRLEKIESEIDSIKVKLE